MKKMTTALMLLSALTLTACQTTSAIDTATPSSTAMASAKVVNAKTSAAKSQFEQGNYGLAQKEYLAEVETHPQNSVAWLGLAAAYDKLGRFDLADSAYEKLISIEGRKAAILNNYGYSHIMRGNTKKARSLLNEARATAPLNPIIESNWKLAYAS